VFGNEYVMGKGSNDERSDSTCNQRVRVEAGGEQQPHCIQGCSRYGKAGKAPDPAGFTLRIPGVNQFGKRCSIRGSHGRLPEGIIVQETGKLGQELQVNPAASLGPTIRKTRVAGVPSGAPKSTGFLEPGGGNHSPEHRCRMGVGNGT
jgi:hypothetical protein